MGSKPNVSLIHPKADLLAIQQEVATRTVFQTGWNSAISVVHPAELSSETRQTPQSLRLSAIAAMHGIASLLGEAYLWSSP